MRLSQHRHPELLAPAGSLKSLRYALAYGADAVYAGLPRYSLRVRNNAFRNVATLAEGIDAAHAEGKKFLLAVNVMPHNQKVHTFIRDLEPVVALKPDALIMTDPGLIMLVRERWTDMPIHLSVQANTVNYAAVRFWQAQGIARVILSRELSLDEIAEIRQRCPDIELEVFVHGALCVAYSGRCLLSGYFNHRDSNQGACTNACRWRYRLDAGVATAEGTLLSENNVFLLAETARRGDEWMEISEDEHGTYIMNSRDLRAIAHVARLIEIGVDCLKIEGRTKSHYYVARTTQVYRRAIVDALAHRAFDSMLIDELDALAHRGYTEGFFSRHTPQETQNYDDGASSQYTQRFVAEVIDYDNASGLSTLAAKNRFAVGDQICIVTPNGNRIQKLSALWNTDGEPVSVASGDGYIVRAKIGDTGTFALIARIV
ncbi:MAG: tRNA 5-hydroxyuridine modification protein YegQ [Burkholderiales bacterium]|jgi:putative protease|nr:tRNA 5-hydroxyuridine modification protein YegQ [Burkholderiales bacterium]